MFCRVGGQRLVLLRRRKKTKLGFPIHVKDKYYKSGIKYFGLLTDARGLQWFATEDGIRIWDKKTERLYLLTMSEGLPNNTVSSILEDCDGVVWASTLNGICKIIPREEGKGGYRFSVVAFGVPDGLQSGMFYDHAALKAKNGMLYFGGAHGLIISIPVTWCVKKLPTAPS